MSRRAPSALVASGLTRRGFAGLSLAAMATALVGCTSYDEKDDGGEDPSGSPAPDFEPVTIEHEFGSTEISERPVRVVSAGLTEQDFLLALGVVPVAVTDWYGDQPNAVWPWAQEALGDAEPEVLNLNDGPQYTRIAAATPDLIVACNASLTNKTYDKLADIKATIAQPKDAPSNFATWKDVLPMIGAAVGQSELAETIKSDLEAKFATAKDEHPDWTGKKAIFLQNAVYDGSFIAYQDGLSTALLTDLGFEIPSELEEFVGEGQAYIPVERIDVLDSADVLIWGTESDDDKTALEKVAGFDRIKAVAAGNSIYTGGELAGAIYFDSPLSLSYVVDELVPLLEDTNLTA